MRALRIICIQSSPLLGQVQRNIHQAESLLEGHLAKHGQGRLDLIFLPEMAFTGYRVRREHVASLVKGQESSKWASQIAKRYNCNVVLGHPVEHQGLFYNAASCFDRLGQEVHRYHKSFLYYDDEIWAQEGDGFKTFVLDGKDKARFGKTSLAICMDLNPYRFVASFDAFELATYVKNESVDTLLLCNAWLRDPSDPTDSPVNYWRLRLTPLWISVRPVLVIICNRSGKEAALNEIGQEDNDNVVSFAGHSLALMCGNGQCRVLDALDSQEGVLDVTVERLLVQDSPHSTLQA